MGTPTDLTSGLTAEELRSLLYYDPETGIFTWRKPPARKPWLIRAGNVSPGKYTQIQLFPRSSGRQERYYASRLAWLYMTGNWPENEIDHINRDKSDDSWKNLRPADHSKNAINVDLQSRNTSGITGVCWDGTTGRWLATCMVKGVTVLYKQYDTKEEAIAARQKVVREHYGEYVP
jgi:hypothetical protein